MFSCYLTLEITNAVWRRKLLLGTPVKLKVVEVQSDWESRTEKEFEIAHIHTPAAGNENSTFFLLITHNSIALTEANAMGG